MLSCTPVLAGQPARLTCVLPLQALGSSCAGEVLCLSLASPAPQTYLTCHAGQPARLTSFLRDYKPWAADVPEDLSWISVSSGRPASNGSGSGAAAFGSYEVTLHESGVGRVGPL